MLSIHHSLAAAAVNALALGLASPISAADIRTPAPLDAALGARVTPALAPGAAANRFPEVVGIGTIMRTGSPPTPSEQHRQASHAPLLRGRRVCGRPERLDDRLCP
jgi:hypothetical protein